MLTTGEKTSASSTAGSTGKEVEELSHVEDSSQPKHRCGAATTAVPVSYEEFLALQEKFSDARTSKTLRKVDYRLLPMLAIVYLLSFMDKAAIGNARLFGLQKDLKLTQHQYDICVLIVMVPYVAVEPFANIAMKFVGPKYWITALVLSWGTVMTLSGLCTNYSGMLAARFFLGLCEGGLFPAVTYLVTQWYRRFEVQRRFAAFFVAATMAGAFAGLFAYAIGFMDGYLGHRAWRYILGIEGLLTVAVGFSCPFLIIDLPSKPHRWLSEEERTYLITRIEYDAGPVAQRDVYDKKSMLSTFTDWKIYVSMAVLFSTGISIYATSFSLPSIVRGFGYSPVNANLITVPIYAYTSIYGVVVAVLADRYQRRAPWVLISLTKGIIGLLILLGVQGRKSVNGVSYFALFLLVSGVYGGYMSMITWAANNMAGPWKRALGMALCLTAANSSAIVSSLIFPSASAPAYNMGYGLCLGFLVVFGLGGATINLVCLKREQARRDAITPEEIKSRWTDAELMQMGDQAPTFKFTF